MDFWTVWTLSPFEERAAEAFVTMVDHVALVKISFSAQQNTEQSDLCANKRCIFSFSIVGNPYNHDIIYGVLRVKRLAENV